MANEYAAIPDPVRDIDGLYASVEALKQTVEALIGQRGTDVSTVVTKQELADQANLAGVDPTVARTNLGLASTATSTCFAVANNLSEGTAATMRTNIGIDTVLGFGMLNGTLACSVGSSALTIAIKDRNGSDPSATSPVVVFFRNATAATGTYTEMSITAATSLVISSGSTMGTSSL